MSHLQPTFCLFTLNGLFTDDKKKMSNPTFAAGEELRYFNRVFALRPSAENGYVV